MVNFHLILKYGEKQVNKEAKKKNKKIIQQPLPPSPSTFEKIKIILTHFRKWIVGGSAFIASLIVIGMWAKGCFTSKKQKWEDENTQQGDIKSTKISENTAPIIIHPNFEFDTTIKFPKVIGVYIKGLKDRGSIAIAIGEHIFMCPVASLYQGVEILHPIFKDCSNSILALAAKDDRLYVSAKFISLNDTTEIGEMEYNHWTIYNGTHKNYNYDNERFEVNDNQGNIVFSIAYSDDKMQPFVSIAGYFVSPTSVIVLVNRQAFTIHTDKDVRPQDCFLKSESNWKVNAEMRISQIQSEFKKKLPKKY